ncbi:Indigoidine synthase A like protein-domain-containing protein [Lasiosphaeris hirsuta]|uniref:Indigoidine synthase A like protein-domain-containing protein n=1 Tax=Lasiosphaeris hirsuta TaxID=260670 RepID=A0AA40BCP4_9PEZI|nr:Indigoidine synthase A like protein-domain-containing protein [Lasiosphaeris hirsuta]
MAMATRRGPGGLSLLRLLHPLSSRRLISDRRSGAQCLHTVQTRLKTGLRFYHNEPSAVRGLQGLLNVSPEVADAVATNKPVVALESTIYTHGAFEQDLLLEEIVRRNGAVPAVCGILAGVPTVGLFKDEVARMVNEGAKKASRRDLAHLVGLGLTGQKIHGATTIAGTMVLARLAGIRVFGTGGLGGVHRGGHDSMDISADLTELGRTRVAVISSGCKGFLDIPRTLEFLETQGCFVSTFADGRTGDVDFPAFWARDSGSKSPSVVMDEQQAAAIILAQEQLDIESGLLFANPIPEEFGIPQEEMDAHITLAIREADEKGFSGAANTPYILNRLKELTMGRSVPANIALVQGNVARAAKVAVELSRRLEWISAAPETTTHAFQVPASLPLRGGVQEEPKIEKIEEQRTSTADILVAGSVALDLSCDYSGGVAIGGGKAVSPALHVSNPAAISQSVGGVGHNVALAAHLVSDEGKAKLCSMVGDDIAGSTILSSLATAGLDISCIRQLGHEYPSTRTAQYVSVNDADKNLVLAMADMAIFTAHSFPAYWNSAVAAARPKWLVVDGNWAAPDIRIWVRAGRRHHARVAFEPVSAAKAARLFATTVTSPSSSSAAETVASLGVFPRASVDLATPNQFELDAMYAAAREGGFFEDPRWFDVIDALGMVGARDRFVRLTSAAMTDVGIPVQTVQLLPYIPAIITKLGANGALLTELLSPEDPRLRDPREARHILARCGTGHPTVGGVYMRLFPAMEHVGDVASVNGVGDTFLGVMIAGLAQGGRVVDLVDVAQRAAVMTLRSREAVSPELGALRGEVRLAAMGLAGEEAAGDA